MAIPLRGFGKRGSNVEGVGRGTRMITKVHKVVNDFLVATVFTRCINECSFKKSLWFAQVTPFYPAGPSSRWGSDRPVLAGGYCYIAR